MVRADTRRTFQFLLPLLLATAGINAPGQAPDRAKLISEIAGTDNSSAAELLRLFKWGSRPWESTAADPVVVEQKDVSRNLNRTFYFALEAGDLSHATPHLPRSRREEAFARAVERMLNVDGPGPWPVFVFSGTGGSGHGPSIFSLATTRRIFVREGDGAPKPAAAILLNSEYWGTADAELIGEDRLTEIVAAHELFHAKRAWNRARETATHADAIESRLNAAGLSVDNRAKLESLVQQGMLAWEEVEAVDRSLAGLALPTYRKQTYIEYREHNREIQKKVVKLFSSLFTSVREGGAKKELENWLTDLLRRDLSQPLE